MATRRGATREVVSVFREALLLEREALGAYAAAIGRLADEPLTRDTAAAFLSAHERHFDALGTRLRALGVQEVQPDASPPRLLPAERFADARGTSAALLLLRMNADELVRRYRELLTHPLPEDDLSTLRRICNDELRHRAWLAARVQAFAAVEHPGDARPSAAPHGRVTA